MNALHLWFIVFIYSCLFFFCRFVFGRHLGAKWKYIIRDFRKEALILFIVRRNAENMGFNDQATSAFDFYYRGSTVGGMIASVLRARLMFRHGNHSKLAT